MKICPRCSEVFGDDAARCSRDGAELHPVLDPLIGKTVGGRYRLIARLGSGGMSSVYLARHVMIDRLMAIKTLRRDLATDPVQRDRFVREARAVNRINHENIVEITDFGETDDGLVYLVMEYVPGESLLKALVFAPFPSARALHIAEQCANALGRAHQMGVVHRDLKPENILLVQRKNRPDFVKILDFGIAKILDAPSLTGSQQIFGTPGYIAPEYIQSTDIDGRADLYSLGVILYEMITGALPFDYEYPGDLLVKHVSEQPVAPRERHPDVEGAIEELILRCLEKDPANRFRDAYHFLEELQKVRERIGSPEWWGPMGRVSLLEEEPQVEDLETPVVTRGGVADALVGAVTQVDITAPPAVQRPSAPRMKARPRQPTVGYERRQIPPAPSDTLPSELEVPIAVENVESDPIPRDPTPKVIEDQGLLGARRWRRRYDAIRTALDELELERPAPADVAQGIARASRALEDLEEGVGEAERIQTSLEEVEQRAREMRASVGAEVDAVARSLSRARGELEQIALRRNDLRDRREVAFSRSRHQRGGDDGQADALLWELAAVEEELNAAARKADDLEGRLAEVRADFDAKNEAVEAEIVAFQQRLDVLMARLFPLAGELRPLLESVESFIRGHWDTLPDPDEEASPGASNG